MFSNLTFVPLVPVFIMYSFAISDTFFSVDKTIYEKRPFACPKCQYRTVKLILLKGHLGRCSGGKILMCDQCSYSTLKTNHLNRHKMSHINNTIRQKVNRKNETAVCEVCTDRFLDKSHLRVHMLKHHPGL